MKRLVGMLAVFSTTWFACALVGSAPMSTAAVDTATASIPVDAATSLEMTVNANCVAAEGTCFFDTAAGLRTPTGITGFPGDLWARQTTTLRTMDRSVYVDAKSTAPNTRMFKSLTDIEFTTIYFGGGPPDKFRLDGQSWPVDVRTGAPRTDVPLIVCAHIQVVYAGVNLTSPDACAQAAFS